MFMGFFDEFKVILYFDDFVLVDTKKNGVLMSFFFMNIEELHFHIFFEQYKLVLYFHEFFPDRISYSLFLIN